jgi:hypothetical protein
MTARGFSAPEQDAAGDRRIPGVLCWEATPRVVEATALVKAIATPVLIAELKRRGVLEYRRSRSLPSPATPAAKPGKSPAHRPNSASCRACQRCRSRKPSTATMTTTRSARETGLWLNAWWCGITQPFPSSAPACDRKSRDMASSAMLRSQCRALLRRTAACKRQGVAEHPAGVALIGILAPRVVGPSSREAL